MTDKIDYELDDAFDKVQEIMYQIVVLLNSHGITEVKAGAVMRLLGTTDEEAEPFDNKVMFVNGEFLDLRDADEIPGEHDSELPTSDDTLH